jgi:Acyl-CoA dehydrogenase, C-terminal domain
MKVRGNLALVLQTAVLFGKVENATANKEQESMLRILSPISKLFTAKDCL